MFIHDTESYGSYFIFFYSGLSHILFLPERSSIIECTYEENNVHFDYFASWSNHHYLTVECNPTWRNDVAPVQHQFRKAITRALEFNEFVLQKF